MHASMMPVRLDVARRDLRDSLLAECHWRFGSCQNERANELQSTIVVARIHELIATTRPPVVRELPERRRWGLRRFRLMRASLGRLELPVADRRSESFRLDLGFALRQLLAELSFE
jgi:hypothetical protein